MRWAKGRQKHTEGDTPDGLKLPDCICVHILWLYVCVRAHTHTLHLLFSPLCFLWSSKTKQERETQIRDRRAETRMHLHWDTGSDKAGSAKWKRQKVSQKQLLLCDMSELPASVQGTRVKCCVNKLCGWEMRECVHVLRWPWLPYGEF